MKALDKIPVRQASKSERDFFQKNQHVAGMAAEDNQVVLNPFSRLNKQQQQAVVTNERVRVFLRQQQMDPYFQLSDEQRLAFKGYGTETDVRHTIIGRAIAGDPTAGRLTSEQQKVIGKINMLLSID